MGIVECTFGLKPNTGSVRSIANAASLYVGVWCTSETGCADENGMNQKKKKKNRRTKSILRSDTEQGRIDSYSLVI